MNKLLISLALSITVVMLSVSLVFGMTVTLTCDPNTENDLAGYKIYTSGIHGGPYTRVGEYPYGPNIEPIMVVPNLPENERVYFVATAYDAEGLESGYSNEVSVASTDNRPPASPI